jgi:hypothetical protein
MKKSIGLRQLAPQRGIFIFSNKDANTIGLGDSRNGCCTAVFSIRLVHGIGQ